MFIASKIKNRSHSVRSAMYAGQTYRSYGAKNLGGLQSYKHVAPPEQKLTYRFHPARYPVTR